MLAKLKEVWASFKTDDDSSSSEVVVPTPITEFIRKHQFALLGLALLCIAVPMQMQGNFPTWIADQVRGLFEMLVAPVPDHFMDDTNYWSMHIMVLALVCLMAFLLNASRTLWKERVLNELFLYPWQRKLFEHFMMSAVEDTVFTFICRQITMVCVALMIPSVNPMPHFEEWGPWARYMFDGKVTVVVLYMSVTMLWYGNKVRLFTPELHWQPIVGQLAFVSHWFVVALMRVYPAFNAAGYGVWCTLLVSLLKYPVPIFLLGWTAVVPGMYFTSHIKRTVQHQLMKIICLFAVHVTTVVWTSHMGRQLGLYMVSQDSTLFTTHVGVETVWRVLYGVLLGAVCYMYAHVITVMYRASPLFLCEWGMPIFQHAQLKESPQLVHRLFEAFTMVLRGPSARHSSSTMHMLLSWLRSALGMTVAVFEVMQDVTVLHVQMHFVIDVTNFSIRPLTMQETEIRCSVQTQMAAKRGEGPSLLALLRVHQVDIPPGGGPRPTPVPIQVVVDVTLYCKTLISLEAIARSADSLDRLDVALAHKSTMSRSMYFVLPLLSYYHGTWYRIVQSVNIGPSAIFNQSAIIARTLKRLQQRQHALSSLRLAETFQDYQDDLDRLSVILTAILAPEDPQSPESRFSLSRQLLECAYLVVSLLCKEEEVVVMMRSQHVQDAPSSSVPDVVVSSLNSESPPEAAETTAEEPDVGIFPDELTGDGEQEDAKRPDDATDSSVPPAIGLLPHRTNSSIESAVSTASDSSRRPELLKPLLLHVISPLATRFLELVGRSIVDDPSDPGTIVLISAVMLLLTGLADPDLMIQNILPEVTLLTQPAAGATGAATTRAAGAAPAAPPVPVGIPAPRPSAPPAPITAGMSARWE